MVKRRTACARGLCRHFVQRCAVLRRQGVQRHHIRLVDHHQQRLVREERLDGMEERRLRGHMRMAEQSVARQAALPPHPATLLGPGSDLKGCRSMEGGAAAPPHSRQITATAVGETALDEKGLKQAVADAALIVATDAVGQHLLCYGEAALLADVYNVQHRRAEVRQRRDALRTGAATSA